MPVLTSTLGISLICNYVGGQVTLTNLGSLETSDFSSNPSGVNADGTVVVGSAASDTTNSRAFRWTITGGMENLGTLSGLPIAVATGVSADGLVVVGRCSNSNESDVVPFRWTSATGLEALSMSSASCAPSNFGIACGISGDGAVIVGYGCGYSWPLPIRWTSPTTLVELGTGYQGRAQALATNFDGTVVCGVQTPYLGAMRAVLLGNGDPQPLATPPGGFPSGATCISADGLVAAGWCIFYGGGPNKAVRWSASGELADLGTLRAWAPSAPNSATYQSLGVSGDGQIVVGWAWSGETGHIRAFLWTQALGMVDLRDYLTGAGIDMTGINQMTASAVSVDGTSIVGAALFAGQRRAFLIRGLHLVPDPCPGDISGNHKVDGVDLAALLGTWGTNGQGEYDCDIDNDGIVGGPDLTIILGGWGPCPN